VAVPQNTFTHKHTMYDELDKVKVIKIGRLRWLGHLFRMNELNPCRKFTVLKPEGTRPVGKPKLNDLSQLRKIQTKWAREAGNVISRTENSGR